MEQLSGLDSTFIYGETARTPMHLSAVLIYDPSTAAKGTVTFDDILDNFSKRLHRSTVFRRKLLRVPLELDRPYWVEDPDFDLEFHLRHIALPNPGDWQQFTMQISRLHSRPLDMWKPLWEAYVIEGLDGIPDVPKGSFGFMVKVHHSAVDGATGTQIMGAIHDLSPVVESTEAAISPIREHTLGTARLLMRASVANLRDPLRFVRIAGSTLPAWSKAMRSSSAQAARMGVHEKTRFNDIVSPQRAFGATEWKLDDVKAMKQVVEGATVNDVMLTIVAGALRRYLTDKQEPPEETLIAGVPVNVRVEGEEKSGGNVVSVMGIALRDDIEVGVDRLRAVHEEAVASKAYHNAIGARTLTDLGNSLPSLITALGFRAASAAGLSAVGKPMYNLQVTNVPGPQVPLYMSGAKMVSSLSAGPPMDNLGLFHAVTSYASKIAVSFTSCRKMMPDPGFYEECLRESFDELMQSTGCRKKAKGSRKTRK